MAADTSTKHFYEQKPGRCCRAAGLGVAAIANAGARDLRALRFSQKRPIFFIVLNNFPKAKELFEIIQRIGK